jgi:hypothetical protein
VTLLPTLDICALAVLAGGRVRHQNQPIEDLRWRV